MLRDEKTIGKQINCPETGTQSQDNQNKQIKQKSSF